LSIVRGMQTHSVAARCNLDFIPNPTLTVAIVDEHGATLGADAATLVCPMLKHSLHLSQKARRRIAGFYRLIAEARETARLHRNAAERNGYGAFSLDSREGSIIPLRKEETEHCDTIDHNARHVGNNASLESGGYVNRPR